MATTDTTQKKATLQAHAAKLQERGAIVAAQARNWAAQPGLIAEDRAQLYQGESAKFYRQARTATLRAAAL